MKRLILALAISILTVSALALPKYFTTFETTYKIDKDSKIHKAKCMNCHLSQKGGKLNPYGLDLKAALKKAETKKVTAAILKTIEDVDSTKSGDTNIEKIKADTPLGTKKDKD